MQSLVYDNINPTSTEDTKMGWFRCVLTMAESNGRIRQHRVPENRVAARGGSEQDSVVLTGNARIN